MDILLSSDVFKVYFSERAKFEKSEIEKDIVSIIENPNNKIILSKFMLNLIEKSIEDNYLDTYHTIIEHITSTKSINISANDKSDEHEALNEMYNNYKQKITSRNLFLCMSIGEILSLKTKNSIIIDQLEKPNWDWILLKVACQNPKPVNIRYFEFPNNQNIQSLFDNLFNVIENINYVMLYDKQQNLTHDYFKKLRTGVQIHYYTSINHKNQKDVVKTIQKHFQKVKIFTAKPNFIHERRLILNHLIIECDDDFQNLSCERPTWMLSISHCKKTSLELSKKNDLHFQRCNG